MNAVLYKAANILDIAIKKPFYIICKKTQDEK